MGIRYKQRCFKCKKNYVLANWKQKYVTCYECEKDELNKVIKDVKMREMFNVPEGFYKENSFLRSIKLNYIRNGKLSERQIEAFKETIKKLKEKG